MKYKKQTKSLGLLAVGLASILGLVPMVLHAETITRSLGESKIFGYYPYMKSIGTIMYRADSEGNRGGFDANGKRVPTVGSIIGFKDLFCGENIAAKDTTPNFSQIWQPYFDYDDKDLDVCNLAQPHKVEWFFFDTGAKDISEVTSWSEISGNAVKISDIDPNAIIEAKSSFTYPDLSNPQTDTTSQRSITVPISGDITTAVRVPEAAVGKYIGVRYTPLSATGIPIEGKAVEMWDLNHFYSQTPPSRPGIDIFNLNDGSLSTQRGALNSYTGGSGGGRVLPALERPEIRNFAISGVMAPGQTLTLAYDFIPYPQSKSNTVDATNDRSVFFWGLAGSTLVRSDNFDETKTVEENNQLGTQIGRITQGNTVTLTLDDVGTFFEVTALPMRKANDDVQPVTGRAQTHLLSDFAASIEATQRPIISGLKLNNVPKVGEKLTAQYIYVPSNSIPSYDASAYRWSFNKAGVDTTIVEGVIKTSPDSIPDYTNPVAVPDSGAITLEQLGVAEITPDMAGNVITLRMDAIDATGLTGNWAEIDTSQQIGTPNDMFAIKLVEYNYGGSFPLIRQYGKGFPSTGFAGATFRLFAEDLKITTNQTKWTWDIVENSHYAKVDNTGMVTLTRIPPKDGVIRVIATNNADPKIVRSHSFTIDKWLISFDELNNGKGAKGYILNDATALCNNFTRADVKKVSLPTVSDYTSLPVDPKNPNQSLGAHVRSAGWNTIFTFPSTDFFSQWGELDVYKTVDRARQTFPEAGTAYTWTRDVQNGTNKPIFAAPTGWGDWFVWADGNKKLNAACIAYADDFVPEIPPYSDSYMRGIKLVYLGYPKNNVGFPTAHQYGKGFPSLGFNGATFILFAQDEPGSKAFNGADTSNNEKWTWQINGGSPASQATYSSKNRYAFVTYKGEVVLVSPPPRGFVFEVTATNGSKKLSHSFTLDKWLYGFRDLNVTREETITSAQSICSSNNLRVPARNEFTSMPFDPKNPERSLGFGTKAGWDTIYTFPSNDYYSQWGQMNVYWHYDPVTMTINSEGNWYPGDYITADKSPLNNPITARISGWGDWLSWSGDQSKTKFYMGCIGEPELKSPAVSNVTIQGVMAPNNSLTGKYTYTAGVSIDSKDNSQYRWLVNGTEVSGWKLISTSGTTSGILVTPEVLGQTVRLEVKAIDKSGLEGNIGFAEARSPAIKDLRIVYTAGFNVGDTLTGAYTFEPSTMNVNATDKSTYTWKGASTGPQKTVTTTGMIDAYTVVAADVGSVISLTATAKDSDGMQGNTLSVQTLGPVPPQPIPPQASNLSIEGGPFKFGSTVYGKYKFMPGSNIINRSATSLISTGATENWLTNSTLVSGDVYRTADLVLGESHVGKTVQFSVKPIDGINTQGTIVSVTNTEKVITGNDTSTPSPTIANIVVGQLYGTTASNKYRRFWVTLPSILENGVGVRYQYDWTLNGTSIHSVQYAATGKDSDVVEIKYTQLPAGGAPLCLKYNIIYTLDGNIKSQQKSTCIYLSKTTFGL